MELTKLWEFSSYNSKLISQKDCKQLPIEVWRIIAYNLKFELNLYKNCSRINKQLYKIVRQIHEKMPDSVYIKIRPWNEFEQYEMIDVQSVKSQINKWNVATISSYASPVFYKNELLLGKHIHIYVPYNSQIIVLKMQDLFDKELNQICRSIVIKNSHGGNGLYYCKNDFC